jgi:hypothetical protein
MLHCSHINYQQKMDSYTYNGGKHVSQISKKIRVTKTKVTIHNPFMMHGKPSKYAAITVAVETQINVYSQIENVDESLPP